MSAFESTIQRFKLLPPKSTRSAAWLFVCSEIAVVVLIILGKQFLQIGFGAAMLLLVAFSITLFSVIKRKMAIPCNCFGVSDRPVSIYDIGRNFVFIICAAAGEFLYAFSQVGQAVLNRFELLLIGFSSLAFVLVIINGSDFFEFFDISFSKDASS